MPWRFVLTLLFALVCGCGADEGPSDPPELVLGTGEWQFEPALPSQHLTLVAGTQGGYHVWLSMRVRRLSGARLRMQLELMSAGPAPLARSDLDIPFEAVEVNGERGWLEHVGWPAQLLEPWCAVDRELTIRVSVTDASERRAEATLLVVPTAPPRGFAVSCTL